MKCFCDFLTMKAAIKPESGMTIKEISVSFQEIVSIMNSTPTMFTIELRTWEIVIVRLLEILSTSLVTLDRTSPWVLESKYFKGSVLIFLEISSLSL